MIVGAATDGPIFSTRYAVSRAQNAVWLPLVVSAALGLAGLYMNQFALTVFSAFITLAAIRHWPLTDTQRVVLRLTPDGFDLDGAGRVVWASVAQASVRRVRAKKAQPAFLDIQLTEPIDIAAIAMPAMRRRPWEVKPWRKAGDTRIILFLHNFSDAPEDVVGAFAHFLGARFEGPPTE